MMIDENQTFLYDTYALIEVLKNNPRYEKYTTKNVIINKFIFAEFCYKLFLDDVKDAREYLDELIPAIVKVDASIIERAMLFRVKNKKRKMSMTDCISYIQARKLGVKFLTGDKEFENLENVEFVKK